VHSRAQRPGHRFRFRLRHIPTLIIEEAFDFEEIVWRKFNLAGPIFSPRRFRFSVLWDRNNPRLLRKQQASAIEAGVAFFVMHWPNNNQSLNSHFRASGVNAERTYAKSTVDVGFSFSSP